MHIPVLVEEVIKGLNLKAGDTFLDGTLGSAGHSSEVARLFGDSVAIIGLDRDAGAIRRSEERLRTLTTKAHLFVESFRDMDKVLSELGIHEVSGILLDLGISSDQLENSGRGFTFQKDEPLQMTMSEGGILTAEGILNTWEEETLELIIRGFGEERYSRRIAHEIVMRREELPFKTTKDLLDAVEAAVPKSGYQKINPATKTFQALRIAVNEELSALEEGLAKGFAALAPKGRLAVISFHSLEDRIVKNFFRDRAKEDVAILVTKKPITATKHEVEGNPRSRSAKLRVLEKN